MKAVLVSRASHSQNTPHVRRPHSAPTTRVMPMNSTPAAALAPASRSQPRECFLEKRYTPEARAVTKKARYASHAEGTWTYRMRTDSRWLTSAGENPRPKAASQTMPTMAAAPRTRVAFVDVPVVVTGPLGVAVVLVAGRLANVSPTRR